MGTVIRLNKVQSFSSHVSKIFSPTSVCLSTFFYPKLRVDPKVALSWLTNTLNDQNLLFGKKFDVKEILIPVNLNDSHWILVFLNLNNLTFFAINPYHPNCPDQMESDIAKFIAESVGNEFARPSFKERRPNHIYSLPIQEHEDSINCGVYVSLYMVIYSFGSDIDENIAERLPENIDECRMLILGWFLRGLIYFP